ncbi:MAG: arylamine N-acetyltransferase [Planctomycetota bacterium]
MDTKSYLRRLDLDEISGADFSSLERMQERHLLLVPFENLDIMEGLPISLEPSAVYDKIVTRRRGGICYELNSSFAALLEALGYKVQMLAAELRQQDGSYGIPYDHMTLRVDLPEGPYLVDVGYRRSFRHPIPLVATEEIRQFGETYGLRKDGDDWILERYERTEMGMMPLYRFKEGACEIADFDGACQFHQTSPASGLTKGLVVTAATPDGRVRLDESELRINQRGRLEVIAIKDFEDRSRMLRRYFGIKSAVRMF